MSMVSLENFREEKGSHRATVTADMETIEEIVRSGGELSKQLLPGIPDDITFNVVITKLSWSDLRALFTVSRSWKTVIRDGLVYNMRVRECATDNLAVVFKTVCETGQCFATDPRNLFSLYSMSDKSWFKLPPIPGRNGFGYACRCMPLDGRLYILGGIFDLGTVSKEVYVWDLGRQSKWKQCASMLDARQDFSVAVRDGKIYVFGGTYSFNPPCGCEEYDPKVDAWSSIKSEGIYLQPGCHVATMGQELLLHGGEIYDPIKDEWTWKMPDFTKRIPYGSMFLVRGKFHAIDMKHCCIYVLDSDTDKQVWKVLQSFSRNALPGSDPGRYKCLAMDDELLLLMYGVSWSKSETCLLRSRGFGQDSKEIVWQIVTFDYCQQVFGLENCSFMCSIQV